MCIRKQSEAWLSICSVSLFPTSTSHCSPGSLQRIVVSSALLVPILPGFVSRVAPFAVGSETARVVTNGFES